MIALLAFAAAFLQQDDVEKWIRQLGDESIEVREGATRRLRERGEAILPRLEKALSGATGEVRARLSALVSGIRKDDEFAKVFGPTKRITLSGKALKLGDVLDSLALAGSIAFAFGKVDPEKLIAVDLANVTWWEAVDRVVHSAGAGYQLDRSEDFSTAQIKLTPSLQRPFARTYQDQFRIGVVEIKQMDYVAPGTRESATHVVVEAHHQPNLKPSDSGFRDPIQIKSLWDAKGADPRVPRPDWAGGSFLGGQPLTLHLDFWVAPDAAFPLTLEGVVDVPFAKGSQEVVMRFDAAEATKIGGVTLKIKNVTRSKTAFRFELVATSWKKDANLGSSMVPGSLVLIDSKDKKHAEFEDGWHASEGESTWEYTFDGELPEPKEIRFSWIAEYHRIAIPFRLEGIQLPK